MSEPNDKRKISIDKYSDNVIVSQLPLMSCSGWRIYARRRDDGSVRRHAWCTMFNACRFAVALRRGRRKLNRNSDR